MTKMCELVSHYGIYPAVVSLKSNSYRSFFSDVECFISRQIDVGCSALVLKTG